MAKAKTTTSTGNGHVSAGQRRALNGAVGAAVSAVNENERARRRNRRGLKRALNDTWTVLNEQRAAGAHTGGGFISGSTQADDVAAATAAGTVGRGARRHGRKSRDAAATSPPPTAPRSKAARRKARKKARERRAKIVSKIPRKRKAFRIAARAGLALGAGGWAVARVGGRVVAAGGRRVAGHVETRAQERRWTPQAIGQRWFSASYTCAACDESHTDAEALNRHMLQAHADEPRAIRKPTPSAQLIKATTRRHNGKVAVLLPPEHAQRPRRRHVAGRTTDPDRRATALVAKYRDNITRIGDHAVGTVGEARTVSQGFKAWGDLRPPQGERKWTLQDLRDIHAGMERALLDGVDASASLEHTLTKPGEAGGAGIAREVISRAYQKFRDDLAAAAGDLTMAVALVEDAYAPYIRAALEKPEIDFGQRSS
jgi:hypothetical protein